MPDLIEDQAASLRRLLGGATLHSLLFIGGDSGTGQSALVANVAHAMAQGGQSVLVIDAQPQLRSGARWFGLSPRGDLAEAMAGKRRLDDLLLHAPGGVTWLPAARLSDAPGTGAQRPSGAQARVLAELAARFDTVLIDVPTDRVRHWTPAAAHAGAVLLGSSEAQRSITSTYSALKSLSWQNGQQRYLWWIARATASAPAEAAYRKVAQTAQRFLHMQLGFAGPVPADPMVGRAERMRRPVVEAFPASRYAAACAMLAVRLSTLPRRSEAATLLWDGLLGFDPDPDASRTPTDSRHSHSRSPDAAQPRPIGAPDRTELVSR